MIPAGVVAQILEAGVRAPSGDNLQPWIVRRDGDTFHLAVDPERDQSLYNFRRRASLIALGAMIENMVIAAREHRLDAEVSLRREALDLVSATLAFRTADVARDPLFPSVALRCTNRRSYRKERLPAPVVEALAAALPADGRSDLRFIQDAKPKRILAEAASLNDRLLFEIKPLHERFFESVRWTPEEAERTRDGLFVKTLELGPMSAGFRAMRSWTLTRALNSLGASAFAPRHSYQTFLRSAALGFLQMSGDEPEAYVEGGRRLERVWLRATSLGLSFQPMAGMLYLLNYNKTTSGLAQLTDRQQATIARADALFRRVLPFGDRHAAIMLFRVGHARPPTATSLRREVKS